jgi:hypothetical protein
MNDGITIMGFGVTVEIQGEAGDSIDVGAYTRFARFRDQIVLVVKGKAAAKAAAEDRFAALTRSLFGNNPAMAAMLQQRAPQVTRRPIVSEMDVFLNHSDCDGEFTQDEAKILAKAFKKYHKKFKDSHPEEGFVALYEAFQKAFTKIAKKGGKMIFH